MFALLYQLNDYNCLGYKDIPSDVTCTSQPQSWHIPRAASICPMPVMGTHFARAETDKDGERKRDPVRCKLYEARCESLRKGFERQHVLAHVELLQRKAKPPPFSYLLSDQEPSTTVNTAFGNVTIGSTLSYQLQDFGRPNTLFHINAIRDALAVQCVRPPCISFPELPLFVNQTVKLFDVNELSKIPNLDLQAATTYFQSYVAIDLPGSKSLEKRTVLQGESSEWLEQHKFRVTASNFGKIYHRVQRPSQAW